MNGYSKRAEIRWSDIDPNFHLRHSAYYDFGAFVRISFMTENGLTPFIMQQEKTGPILFREECVFKKEIHFHDTIEINMQLAKAEKDMSRWTFIHEIWKNGNTLSAIITVDGAWIDTVQRKLTTPPALFAAVFAQVPATPDFTWTEKKKA